MLRDVNGVAMPILVSKEAKLPVGAQYAITEFFGKTTTPGSERVSLAIETIDPGVAKARHLHKVTEELYFVLSGSGYVNADGVDYNLGQGDAFYIPIEQPHFLRAGSEKLSVLIVSCPSYDQMDYIKC